MRVELQMVVMADDGTQQRHTLSTLHRDVLSPETLGLTLAESTQILQQLQQIMVDHQVATYLEQCRPCPACGKRRPCKQPALAPLRTLFGVVRIANPRWYHCSCQTLAQKTLRPLAALLPDRTSPELLYLETKWASLVPYATATAMLRDVLPLGAAANAVTVRNHTLRTAQRVEQALGEEQGMFIDGCQALWDQLPFPDGPLAVGLDGGIVRARRDPTGTRTANLFEVIAGKSILAFRRHEPDGKPPSSKCFALVQQVDQKPKRRLFEVLHAQGMQPNQQVIFFSDGGDTVRALPDYLHPKAEHVLDWFHLTMRITVLQQCARGLPVRNTYPPFDGRSVEQGIDSVKHHLWHGNTASALDQLAAIEEWLDGWDYDDDGQPQPQPGSEAAARMGKYVHELTTYVRNNTGSIVNYGERYRQGERISTGFVESTINQVVSKRMVKKQQMQWSLEGAHLLLQVRTRVLNGDWEATFRQWYPGFRPDQAQQTSAPSAA